MANNRTKIEQRDDARRVYKEVTRQLLEVVDTRGKTFFSRGEAINDKLRKTLVEGLRKFISAVDRVNDIDDQIVLFQNSLPMIAPSIMLGCLLKQDQAIAEITEFNKENSKKARAKARIKKNEEMKEVKEYSILTATKYLSENPDFKGTRNALMVQINPAIEIVSEEQIGKKLAESTITKYLKEYNLP